jgi:hypothetical protein
LLEKFSKIYAGNKCKILLEEGYRRQEKHPTPSQGNDMNLKYAKKLGNSSNTEILEPAYEYF